MIGHQWLPWINNPTSSSVSGTSTKQEQDVSSDRLCGRTNMSCHHFARAVGLSALCLMLLAACVTLSILYYNESNSRPQWENLLFDYQNISDRYQSLTAENNDLRADNEIFKEHNVWLEEQNKLLNRTSAKLTSANLALSLEIMNLTSTNLQLTQEHEHLVLHASEQEEEKLNMSQTIQHLVDSSAQQEEEERRLSEVIGLQRDELSELMENNQELVEINDKFQREVKNLSERIGALLNDDCEKASEHNTQLQERNQNLSSALMKERQEAAEREERWKNETHRTVADMQSLNEAYNTLDLYCPVTNHTTKERICKKCENRWKLFENKCYYFSSRTLTWSSSRAWCQTQGGDLLIINSEPEQKFVFETSQTEDRSVSRMWIGMTDAEEEGEWLWVDGSSVTSSVQYWLSRRGMVTEPDDWKLDDPLGEDCGHIDSSENTLESWMDGSCKTLYRWICEKNV